MLKNTSDVSYRYDVIWRFSSFLDLGVCVWISRSLSLSIAHRLRVSLELCRIYLGDCHYGLKDFNKSGSGSIRKTMGYIKLWLGLTEDVENKPYLVVSETKNELSNEMRLNIWRLSTLMLLLVGTVLVDVDGEVLFAYIWIMTNLGWMFQVKNGGIGKQTIFKKTC